MMTRRELLGLLRPGASLRGARGATGPRDGSPSTLAAAVAPAPSPAGVTRWAPRRQFAPRLPPSMVPSVVGARCLALTSFCAVCVERCPAPSAIALRGGLPQIDPARCDGCGQCLAACPAPVLALALVPR
ncbi:MAG: 4Fe-4S binding protein [Myxococcales bacterium]|nr:4Fe-4S binding protein [Myxococcales bacterium]